MNKIATIGSCIAVVCVFTLSAFRVAPYLSSGRKAPSEDRNKAVTRVISNVDIPEYNDMELSSGIEALCEAVGRQVRRSLLDLRGEIRPRDMDATMIAEAFAAYYRVNRTATIKEAVESYRLRGVSPHYLLVQDDSTRVSNAWALSTAWARKSVIDTESIRVVPLYKHGEKIDSPMALGQPVESRVLSSGGALSFDPHSFSAYAIIVKTIVPALDGSMDVEVEIGIAVANDRPGGRWDVAETFWHQVPQDAYLMLPLP